MERCGPSANGRARPRSPPASAVFAAAARIVQQRLGHAEPRCLLPSYRCQLVLASAIPRVLIIEHELGVLGVAYVRQGGLGDLHLVTLLPFIGAILIAIFEIEDNVLFWGCGGSLLPERRLLLPCLMLVSLLVAFADLLLFEEYPFYVQTFAEG